jgi:hypothetical protein
MPDWHVHTMMSVLAVDDRHVAFCEYNGSVARIICVAVATLANEKLLKHASDNNLLLCRKSTSNKTRYRQWFDRCIISKMILKKRVKLIISGSFFRPLTRTSWCVHVSQACVTWLWSHIDGILTLLNLSQVFVIRSVSPLPYNLGSPHIMVCTCQSGMCHLTLISYWWSTYFVGETDLITKTWLRFNKVNRPSIWDQSQVAHAWLTCTHHDVWWT